jgi:hypothetical protein
MNDYPYDSIFPQELADTLISQNAWLIGRIRELEDQIYNLESGATSGNGIWHQQQGQHIRGHAQQQQQLYNSLFSPTSFDIEIYFL